MAIEIRLISPPDRAVLGTVVPGVFDQDVDERWSREFLDDPRHHLIAAFEEDRVIGFASAVHYVHPDKPPELWINEVGVAPPYQRQGVARRLLGAMLDHGASLGCTQAWVLTTPANTAALRLYETLGGIQASEPAVLFEFPLAAKSP